MTRFQEWRITTKATMIAVLVASGVAAAVAGGGNTVTIKETSATEGAVETTTTTEPATTTTTTTTTPAPMVQRVVIVEQKIDAVSERVDAIEQSTTTTTAPLPPQAVEGTLVSVEDRDGATYATVSFTVNHGTAAVVVPCFQMTAANGLTIPVSPSFTNITGTVELEFNASNSFVDAPLVTDIVLTKVVFSDTGVFTEHCT